MANKYQQLQEYSGSLYGSPEYSGLEYDFETPDNIVVGSPGGVSGIHHHYTKGMYSNESSYWDIYGGESPAYPYGEYGSLYDKGLGASFTQSDYPPPTDQFFTQNETEIKRENFGPTRGKKQAQQQSMEIVPIPDAEIEKKKPVNPMVVFLILLVLTASLDFWVNAGEMYLSRDGALDWKSYAIYASGFTFALAFLVMYSDIKF
jgi:hypothetical protein